MRNVLDNFFLWSFVFVFCFLIFFSNPLMQTFTQFYFRNKLHTRVYLPDSVGSELWIPFVTSVLPCSWYTPYLYLSDGLVHLNVTSSPTCIVRVEWSQANPAPWSVQRLNILFIREHQCTCNLKRGGGYGFFRIKNIFSRFTEQHKFFVATLFFSTKIYFC